MTPDSHLKRASLKEGKVVLPVTDTGSRFQRDGPENAKLVLYMGHSCEKWPTRTAFSYAQIKNKFDIVCHFCISHSVQGCLAQRSEQWHDCVCIR